jgi:uncharacterized protein (UPF0333 family)
LEIVWINFVCRDTLSVFKASNVFSLKSSNYLNRKQQIKMNFKWTYLLILVGLIAVILPYVAAQDATEKTMQQKIQEKVAAKVKEQVVEQVQEQVRQGKIRTTI